MLSGFKSRQPKFIPYIGFEDEFNKEDRAADSLDFG
jgi:hypothetical protein